MVSISFEHFIGYLYDLEYDIARCALQSLVTHISVSNQCIACSSWLDLYVELLQTWNNHLSAANSAHSSDYLSFALAPRASLGEQVVIATA